MARQYLEPDGLIDASSIGYSHGIVADGTLYMSGQVGWDESFELAGEDVTAQTRQAFENVETLLGPQQLAQDGLLVELEVEVPIDE